MHPTSRWSLQPQMIHFLLALVIFYGLQ